MSTALGILGALCCFIGLFGAAGSSTPVGQIGSMILLVVAAIFLVGAAVLRAMPRERKE